MEPSWLEVIILIVVVGPPVLLVIGFLIYTWLTNPKTYDQVRLHPERYKNNPVGSNWWDRLN